MRWLPRQSQVSSPWKNGGGTTRAIAVHPAAASLDAFDWRVSAADVVADGPFSAFPGIDRTLVLLMGEGFSLVSPGEVVVLDRPGAVARFPGERPIVAQLLGGPSRDLNVMVRRGVYEADVRGVAIDGPCVLGGIIVGIHGDVTAGGERLACGDAAIGERLDVAGDGLVAVVRVSRCQ